MYCILRVMFAYVVLENAWRIADWPAMKESLHQVYIYRHNVMYC